MIKNNQELDGKKSRIASLADIISIAKACDNYRLVQKPYWNSYDGSTSEVGISIMFEEGFWSDKIKREYIILYVNERRVASTGFYCRDKRILEVANFARDVFERNSRVNDDLLEQKAQRTFSAVLKNLNETGRGR